MRTRRAGVLPPLLAGILLAGGGCLTQPVNTPEYVLGGAFFANTTQAEIDELRGIVKNETGADAQILESLPAQFRVVDLENAECERVRDRVEGKPYLSRLDTCRPESAPEPTEENVAAAPDR